MILQRKEHYSSYVFEDLAPKILQEDPELKARFEERKNKDSEFAGDPSAQLYFIYSLSEHSEKTYRRYPISRIME